MEKVVSGTQCGFRTGRGCVDMIFCVHQLVEKAIEHNAKIFLLFVDLLKAYDSMPRQALWCALYTQEFNRVGVFLSSLSPERMMTSHHTCTVTVADLPLHHNSYCFIDLVVHCWLSRCLAVGVVVQYRIGGKLVREQTRRPLSFIVCEFICWWCSHGRIWLLLQRSCFLTLMLVATYS